MNKPAWDYEDSEKSYYHIYGEELSESICIEVPRTDENDIYVGLICDFLGKILDK